VTGITVSAAPLPLGRAIQIFAAAKFIGWGQAFWRNASLTVASSVADAVNSTKIFNISAAAMQLASRPACCAAAQSVPDCPLPLQQLPLAAAAATPVFAITAFAEGMPVVAVGAAIGAVVPSSFLQHDFSQQHSRSAPPQVCVSDEADETTVAVSAAAGRSLVAGVLPCRQQACSPVDDLSQHWAAAADVGAADSAAVSRSIAKTLAANTVRTETAGVNFMASSP
jgi:hypothetical protein